jgi:hypothetical protein
MHCGHFMEILDAYTEEECRTLCPRGQSRKATALAQAVAERVAALEVTLPSSSDYATHLVALRRLLAQAGDARTTKDVRLDLEIELPSKTLLIDVAGVHPTATSVIPVVRKWRREVAVGNAVSPGVVANNPTARLQSPAVTRTEASKEARYRVLMQLAVSQFPRKRKTKPILLAPVVTHSGEMSPDMITWWNT